jgi:hypothetical protein
MSTAHVFFKICMLAAGSASIVSAAALAYKKASGLTYGESLYKVSSGRGWMGGMSQSDGWTDG